MILAAGRGRRMEPLSRVLPKPALPVLDRPLVMWAVEQAARAGAPRAVVNAWHLADRLEEALGSLTPPIPVAVSREPRLMGTAGGIALARDRGLLGREGPVLVLNGDAVYGLELAALLATHAGGAHDVTMALLPHLDPRRWSRVHLDARGLVTGIAPPGQPSAGEVPLLYPGAMVVSRAALDRIPAGPGDVPAAVWEPARRCGRLGGAVVTGHWREVGTPAAYLEAVLALLGESSWTDPGARVAAGARLHRAMVGAGAVVGAGATVSESIVAAGAVAEPGAVVIRSVLLGRARAAAGERVVGELRAAP